MDRLAISSRCCAITSKGKQLVQNNFQLSVGSTRPFHCVASLHSVIGSVNSHQLDSTLKPTATWSFTFFPRIGQCYSSSLRDWLRKLAPSPQPIKFITKIKCNVVIGVFRASSNLFFILVLVPIDSM